MNRDFLHVHLVDAHSDLVKVVILIQRFSEHSTSTAFIVRPVLRSRNRGPHLQQIGTHPHNYYVYPVTHLHMYCDAYTSLVINVPGSPCAFVWGGGGGGGEPGNKSGHGLYTLL